MKDQDDAQDVLAVASPDIGEDEAAQAAWRHFGIAAQARRLAGERDRNFRLRARDGHEYVLKFSHPAEDPRVADFQAARCCVERADPALPVQRVALAVDGQPCAWHRAPDAPPRAAAVQLPAGPAAAGRRAFGGARQPGADPGAAGVGAARLRTRGRRAGAALGHPARRRGRAAAGACGRPGASGAGRARHGALHRACPAGAARLAGAGHPQ